MATIIITLEDTFCDEHGIAISVKNSHPSTEQDFKETPAQELLLAIFSFLDKTGKFEIDDEN